MAKLAALLESGVNLKTSLREVGLTEIPDQLRLAISLGAPLVPLLRSMNQLEQSCLRAQAELEQALAVPRATRQLLAWLPLITLFLSVAAGLVSIDALLSPISLICVLLGLALLLLGLWLTKRMQRGRRGIFPQGASGFLDSNLIWAHSGEGGKAVSAFAF